MALTRGKRANPGVSGNANNKKQRLVLSGESDLSEGDSYVDSDHSDEAYVSSEDDYVEPTADSDVKVTDSGDEDIIEDDDYDESGTSFTPIKRLEQISDEPYLPHSIHPNTLNFLRIIRENNDREWFANNKDYYINAKKDFDGFTQGLQEELVEYDETLPILPLSDIQFRLYRDMRFSPDGTPYKDYFSIALSRTGKKGNYATYSVVIKCDVVILAGGYSSMGDRDTSPRKLLPMRNLIVENPSMFKQVLVDIQEASSNNVFKSSADDIDGIVAEFCEMNQDKALKRAPKGFDANSKDANLLMLRSYSIRIKLDPSLIMEDDGAKLAARYLSFLEPFVSFLNHHLEPDN